MRVLVACWLVVFGLLITAVVFADVEQGNYPPNPNHAVAATLPNASATPEIGGATPTFARATASTTYNTSDQVAAVSTGVPTIIRPLTFTSGVGTFDTAGATGVRLGEAVVAVALNNEVLTAANWPAFGTPVRTQDAVVAPDGATTADRLEDDSAAGQEGAQQDVTIADDSTIWTATTWVLCTSAHDVQLALLLTGGVTPVTTITTAACSTTWQRLAASATNNTTGNVTATVRVLATDATVSNLGIAEFWRPQLYNENTDVLVDVATAGAAVTVNQEDLSYDAVVVGDVGTLCTWVWMNSNDANTRYVAQWNDVAGAMYRFTFDSTSRPTMETMKLADNMAVTTNQAATDETWNHICWQWNAGLTTQPVPYLNGVATTILITPDHTFSAGGSYGTVLDMTASTAGERILSRTVFYRQVIAPAYMVRLYNRDSALYARAPVPRARDWLYAQVPEVLHGVLDWALPSDPPMPKSVLASVQ